MISSKLNFLASTCLFAVIASLTPFECSSAGAQSEHSPQQVTVPLILGDNGRPYVDVTIQTEEDREETARLLLDTGGGAFILGERIARSLGLEWGEVRREGPHEFAGIETIPDAKLDGFPLELVPERVLVAIGSDGLSGDGRADGLFPGHLLAQYHVVLDYPGGELTLAKPGVIEAKGKALNMSVSKPHGFPRTELEIGGERYAFLLDSGPPASIVSEVIFEKWANEHSNWAMTSGPSGPTQHLADAGGQVLKTIFVSGASWGSFPLDEFAVAAQREGVFERYMSQMMTAPIVGALGSNVLRHFRVELDYANETLYLSNDTGT